MSKISGLNDTIFRQIFFTSGNEKLLKHFLESVLDLKINKLTLLTPILPLKRLSERSKVVDLLVKADDTVINIEVNNFFYKDLNLRNYIYLSSICSTYLDKGDNLKNIPNFLQLNLNSALPKRYEANSYRYEVYDKMHDIKYIDKVKFITFNIDKIKENYYNKGNKQLPKKLKYLIMLKLTGEELKKFCKGDEFMEEYERKYTELTADEIANAFLDAEANERLIRNTIRSEGIEDGMIKGKKEGLAEGKKEGITQATNKLAKNLLKLDIDKNIILKATGLSEKELKQIELAL